MGVKEITRLRDALTLFVFLCFVRIVFEYLQSKDLESPNIILRPFAQHWHSSCRPY